MALGTNRGGESPFTKALKGINAGLKASQFLTNPVKTLTQSMIAEGGKTVVGEIFNTNKTPPKKTDLEVATTLNNIKKDAKKAKSIGELEQKYGYNNHIMKGLYVDLQDNKPYDHFKKNYPELFESNGESQQQAYNGTVKGYVGSLNDEKGMFGIPLLPIIENVSDGWDETTVKGVVGTFGKNVAIAGYNLGADMVNMMLDPVDTVKNLWKLGIGVGVNAIEAVTGREAQGWLGEQGDMASMAGEYLVDRYRNFSDTAYTDPVGLVSDFLAIVGGGASVAGRGAIIASRSARLGRLANAQRLAKLGKAGNVLDDIGRTMMKYDPADAILAGGVYGAKALMQPVGKIASKQTQVIGELGKRAVNNISKKIKNTKEYSIDWATGTTKQQRKKIQENPFQKEYWQTTKNIIDEEGVPTNMKELKTPFLQKIVNHLEETIDGLYDKYSFAGEAYQAIRQLPITIKKTQAKGKVDDLLAENGMLKNSDGSRNVHESAFTKAEANAIADIYDRAFDTPTTTVSGVLNLRKLVSKMARYDLGVSTDAQRVLKGIRYAIDEVAKEQVPQLKELDGKFSKYADELKTLKEGIFYKDGKRNKELKDNIQTILELLNNPNRQQLKSRLVQFMPDLPARIEAINNLPTLVKVYTNPPKISNLLGQWGGVVVGGVTGGLLAGNGIGGLIGSAIVGMLGQKFLSRIRTKAIANVLDNLSPEGIEQLAEIGKKIQANQTMHYNEIEYIKDLKQKIIEEQQKYETTTKMMMGDALKALPKISDNYQPTLNKHTISINNQEDVNTIIKNTQDQELVYKEIEQYQDILEHNKTPYTDSEPSELKFLVDNGTISMKEVGDIVSARKAIVQAQQHIHDTITHYLSRQEAYEYMPLDKVHEEMEKITEIEEMLVKGYEELEKKDLTYHWANDLYRAMDDEDYKKVDKIINKIDKEVNKGKLSEGEIQDLEKLKEEIFESDGYKKNYYSKIEKEIRNSDEMRTYRQLQKKAKAMEEREKSLRMVGRNRIGKEAFDKRFRQRERDRERLIEHIGEELNLDQFDAYDMYEKLASSTTKYKKKPIDHEYNQSLTKEQAQETIRKYFSDDEVSIVFRDKITTPDGREAFGAYFDQIIEFSKNPQKGVPEHEAVHAYLDLFTSQKEKQDIFEYAQQKYKNKIDKLAQKEGFEKQLATEEWLADEFVAYAQGRSTLQGKIINFFEAIWNRIKKIFGQEDKIKSLYEDIINNKRPKNTNTDLSAISKKYQADNITENTLKKEISVRFLNDIEKNIKHDISKKYLENYMKKPDLKGAEKRILQTVYNAIDGEKISKEEFVSKIKSELLDLGEVRTSQYADYNTLRDEEGYYTHDSYTRMYTSPFSTRKTTNHFNEDKYFAHARIEDMGEINRVVEIQSDLFQRRKYKEHILEEHKKSKAVPYDKDIETSNYIIKRNKGVVSEGERILKNYKEGIMLTRDEFESLPGRLNIDRDALTRKFQYVDGKHIYNSKTIKDIIEKAKEEIKQQEQYIKNIEGEIGELNNLTQKEFLKPYNYVETQKNIDELKKRLKDAKKNKQEDEYQTLKQQLQETQNRYAQLQEEYDAEVSIAPKKEVRLNDYANTWYERIVREEIKKAGQAGKDAIQLPDPKTIAKIEGYLGEPGLPRDLRAGELYTDRYGDELLIYSDDYDGYKVINLDREKYRNIYIEDFIADEVYQIQDQAKNSYDDYKYYFENNLSDYGRESIQNHLDRTYKDTNDEIAQKILEGVENRDLSVLYEYDKETADDLLERNDDVLREYVEDNMFSDAESFVNYTQENGRGEAYAYDDRGNIYVFESPIEEIADYRTVGEDYGDDWYDYLDHNQQAVVDFYKRKLLPYAEKYAKQQGKDFEYIEVDGGRWLEIPVHEEDANNPVMAYKRKTKNPT